MGHPDSARRQRLIVALAREKGRVDVTDLADRLGVVAETVRRDLVTLEEKGLMRRDHGSAYPVDGAGFESSLSYRASHLVPEKRRIAAAAVRRIEDAETVFLDEGFTPILVAKELVNRGRPITVLTASLPAATVLAEVEGISVLLLGGVVRQTLGTIGHWATAMLSTFAIDVSIIGTNGISCDRGLTTPVPMITDLKQMAIARARRRLFVGVHTKFGVDGFARFTEVSEFNDLITDRGLSTVDARKYADLGPKVHRV